MAELRISLSPPLMMEGRRRVGRRSHARLERHLRLVEAIDHPAVRAGPWRHAKGQGLAAAPWARQTGEGLPTIYCARFPMLTCSSTSYPRD